MITLDTVDFSEACTLSYVDSPRQVQVQAAYDWLKHGGGRQFNIAQNDIQTGSSKGYEKGKPVPPALESRDIKSVYDGAVLTIDNFLKLLYQDPKDANKLFHLHLILTVEDMNLSSLNCSLYQVFIYSGKNQKELSTFGK